MEARGEEAKYKKESILYVLLLIMMICEIPYVFLVAPIILFIILFILNKKNKIRVNKEFIQISIFIISYFAMDTQLEQSTTFKVLYSLSVISIYLYGINSCSDLKTLELNSQKLQNIIKLISLTFLVYVVITIAINLIIRQFSISRNPIDIWNGTYRAATHYGTMLVFPMVYGCYQIILRNNFREKIFGSLIIIFAVFTCIITASRTILYLIPCVFIIIYYFKLKLDRKIKIRHIRQIVLSLTILAMGIIIFEMNFFNVQTIFNSSQLGLRYASGQATKLEEDSRLSNMVFLFKHLKESLMGGGFTRLHSGNTHNLWLNVYDLSGIVPFTALILYTVSNIKQLGKFIKNKMVGNDTKVLIVSIYIACMLQMVFEPILESVPVFFWSFIYMNGVIYTYSKYKSNIQMVKE